MNKFLVASCLVFMSSSALAEPVKVTIGGSLDTQVGSVQQKGSFKYLDNNTNQAKLSNFGIVNATSIKVHADGKMNNGTKYGGFIKINADTSVNLITGDNTIADKVLFYVENNYGRLEAGAYDGVPSTMQVSANNLARATGGINGVMQKWIQKKVTNTSATPPDTLNFATEFIKWPSLPLDGDYDSNISKVTYYTPEVSGFQVGISYVPNVHRTGTVATLNNTPKHSNTLQSDTFRGFNNVFEGGIKYSGKVQDFDFETSVIAERSLKSKNSTDRRGLFAYEIGALVKYKEFSVATSYSDWTYSGALRTKPTRKGGGYWTLGAAYEKNKFGISATYFSSRVANLFTGDEPLTKVDNAYNKFEVLSIGTDYTVAPGLMPYAEISFFKTKYNTSPANNRGSVLLVGTKLTF